MIFSGIIQKGAGYGRKIGFPTVNIFAPAKDLPPEGVYTGKASLENKEYRAGIVVGPGEPSAPQAPKGQGKIEAHLIGYKGDAYGKDITITIGEFLRAYKKFETEEELINQIAADLKQC